MILREVQGGHRLESETADAYMAMLAAARADGIRPPNLEILSGYRSPEEQERLWTDAVKKYGSEEAARKWTAPPGHSDHEKGIAVDLVIGGLPFDKRDEMRKHVSFAWLVQNAARFGFVNYGREPWHWAHKGRIMAGALGIWSAIPTAGKVVGAILLGWAGIRAIEEYAT